MPENQTAWNSDNKGVKETFTQMGRRGGDGRQAAQRRGHVARQQTAACEAGLAEQKTKDSKLAIKYCVWGGVVTEGETPSLTGEFIGKWS